MAGAQPDRLWSWLRRLSTCRWFAPAALFILSFGLHYRTLWGGFVWDDRPAVVGNRDVWTDSPWGGMWQHDFWGQQMANAQSHKSFRPLATLTFRFSNIVAQKLSEKGRDKTSAAGGQHPQEDHTSPTETGEIVMEKPYFARGAGPENADAVGFHLFNVIVHAATCSSSVWLFRAIFAGEELPAAAASLLFTVHPVHVEAVAPMVGRADLLCGLLSVIALILTITGTKRHKNHPQGKKIHHKKGLALPLHPRGSSTCSELGRSGSTTCLSSSSSNSHGKRSRDSTSVSTSTMIINAKEDRRDPTLSSLNHDVEEVQRDKPRPMTSFDLTTEQPQQHRVTVKAPAFQDGLCFAARNPESSPSLSTARSTTSWPATRGGAATVATAEVCFESGTAGMAMNGDSSKSIPDEGGARNRSGGVATFPKPCHESSVATVEERLLLPTAVAAIATACGDGPKSSPGAVIASGERENSLFAATSGEANKQDQENEGEEDQEQEQQQRREGRSQLNSTSDVSPEATTVHSSAAVATTASCCFSSDEEENEKETQAADRRGVAGEPSAPLSPSQICLTIKTATINAGGESFPWNVGACNAEDERESGPGLARYSAALLLAACATLCKEVGVTVFGLMAGGEIVRFFERRKCRQQQPQPQPQQRGQPPYSSAARVHEELRVRWWWQRSRQRMTAGLSAGAVARVVSAVTYACSLLFLHVRLHEGARVREWGILENDVSILPSRKERALSYAFTHAVYASKLLWPAKLCYDWGFSCVPHVTSFADPANLAPLTLYASILAAAAFAVFRCDTAVMWGLALVVVPFFPASNILFPVGAVVAERLLYLPSLGACVLAGCMLRRRGGSRSYNQVTLSSTSPCSSGEHICTSGTDTTKSGKNSDSYQGDKPPVSIGDEKEEQKDTYTKRRQSFAHVRNIVGDLFRLSTRKNQEGSFPPPGQPSISFSSPASTATSRSPGCRSRTMSLSIQKGSQKGINKSQTWERPIPGSRPSARRTTAVAVLLTSWAAFFGARTMRRCRDWNSERALFESALKVCPDGIKTLNNLAVSMLNEEEAGRAKELLRRAIKLHPNYGFAFFNLGVSSMITQEYAGAVSAFERSLELEPWNTKVMVYLGQVYLELTLKTLDTTLERAPTRAGVNSDSHGINHGGVGDGSHNDEGDADHVRSSSPESLLSSAEFYTDRALGAGTGLPLARLVKGQALALRGQHQLAAAFFQESIDISLFLLSGRGGAIAITAAGSKNDSIVVGVTAGSMGASDAVDLASAYNRLGFALRDSGRGLNAAKEAFIAGLSAAPENLALLINGGVIHQDAGDIPGAKALYHRALSLQPNSPELLNNLGWLEEQTGGRSRSSLETAAELYDRALMLLAEDSPTRDQVQINVRNVREKLMMMNDSHSGDSSEKADGW